MCVLPPRTHHEASKTELIVLFSFFEVHQQRQLLSTMLGAESAFILHFCFSVPRDNYFLLEENLFPIILVMECKCRIVSIVITFADCW